MAARLGKEEEAVSGQTKSTRAVVMDATGELINGMGDSLPGLLQNVDERTNEKPWWMDEQVVARIEMADRVSDPQQELEPEPNPEAAAGVDEVGDVAAAKTVDGAMEGQSVKDKAAALEKGAEADQGKAKGKKGKNKKK